MDSVCRDLGNALPLPRRPCTQNDRVCHHDDLDHQYHSRPRNLTLAQLLMVFLALPLPIAANETKE